MRRDMELVRAILLQVQAKNHIETEPVIIGGYDEDLVARHVEMLFDADMLEGHKSAQLGRGVSAITISDLSWDGHDLLSALQNDTVWSKIKQSFSAKELTGMPLSVLKAVGVELMLEWAKKQVGLSGS